MIRNDSRSSQRSAFTLVELMVVILIIAILVSLISSAVMMALGKIPEVTTRTEISELAVALQAFMTDYNLTNPPPSKLILYENIAAQAGDTSALGLQSYKFLQQVFGKNVGSQPYLTIPGFIDWNNDGQPNGPWLLEGEQCLVFYLGGITPVGAQPQGFSTNNMNPAIPGGKRKGPYFTFQQPRLVSMSVVNALSAAPAGPLSPWHPVYLDPWQVKISKNGVGPMPYVYFSSNGINNGYVYSQGALPSPGYSDCLYVWSTWLGGSWPNPTSAVPYSTGTSYTNSNTYQIISAGKDGVFGFNPTATPPNPGSPYVPSDSWFPSNGAVGPGADDQANFSSTLLGSGQN